MIHGYARVSTQDQELATQKEALLKYGCTVIYEEKVSGTIKQRPELMRMMEQVQPGDTVVVWSLSRLGRRSEHLAEMVKGLQERKIAFVSLKDDIDMSTASGKLIFHLLCALAEMERDLTSERTKATLANKKAGGMKLGRPVTLDYQQVRHKYYVEGKKRVQIARELGVTRRHVYNILKQELV